MILGGVLVLASLVYSGFMIAANDRRWQRFDEYVRARDARWERHIERTEHDLNTIMDRLGRIEAMP